MPSWRERKALGELNKKVAKRMTVAKLKGDKAGTGFFQRFDFSALSEIEKNNEDKKNVIGAFSCLYEAE
jgi:hypothetical protein